MDTTAARQHRNRDAGLPGHPTKFAPRVGSHPQPTNLSAMAADDVRPWDDTSAAYSLVETLRLVNSPDTSLDVLNSVAESDNQVVVRLLAQADIVDRDKAYDVFERLAQSNNTEALRLLGQNKAVPVEILDGMTRLARVTQNEDLAHSLAMNKSSSVASLDELRTHPSWEVRYEVAGNPNTSDAAIESMTKDADEMVSGRAINVRNEREWMDQYAAVKTNRVAIDDEDIAGFIPDDTNSPF